MKQKEEKAKLVVKAGNPQEPLGDLFGIFFEDINHAADGGLYAELVQNRSFEFDAIDHPDYHALYAWEKVEQGDLRAEISIETQSPFCEKNPHYLHIRAKSREAGQREAIRGSGCRAVNGREEARKENGQAEESIAGVCNLGFNDGMEIRKGEQYLFTCYVRVPNACRHELHIYFRDSAAESAPERAEKRAEEAAAGKAGTGQPVFLPKENILGSTVLDVAGEGWIKYESVIEAAGESRAAQLVLALKEAGELELDFVSLFPKHTFRERRNGMRRDLAELLLALKPKFMRFPGGCLVHDGSLDPDARNSMYRWKNTIGPVECRPARRSNWNYNQTLGLGFFEYFQFCEDIGAKPLPVLPGGYDPHHQRMVPIPELGPWVQDALDLIEFANGDETTEWGKKRAELGHPAPFGLEYIAIGNEEVGDAFFERYPYFHKAIKEKYPQVKVINTASPFCAGPEYERGWSSARKYRSDLIDEHYYMAPEWFLAHHRRYDSFKAEEPKVFLGEYASWGNTWWNALAEASYMLGLERNARAVGLACYAPLFANAGYVNWRPDMIWFDQYRAYGTPNYYVQKLFMNFQGTRRLAVDAQLPGERAVTRSSMAGEIRLKGDMARVQFSDITVENAATEEKQFFGSCVAEKDEEKSIGSFAAERYTISCRAKELEGVRGFVLQFGFRDEKNYFQVSFGGWQNLDMFISQRIDGRGCDLTQRWFEVECGREYDLRIDVSPERISVAVDGEAFLAVDLKETVIEPLYYGASVDEKEGCVILKAANLQKEAVDAEIVLEGMDALLSGRNPGTRKEKAALPGGESAVLPCRVLVHTIAAAPEAENDFDRPKNVSPVTEELPSGKDVWPYTFAPMSLTVFQIWTEA